MKSLVLHAERFSYTPVSKEIRLAEEAEPGTRNFGRCLVSFVAVEEGDDSRQGLMEAASRQFLSALTDVGENTMILYPFVHLTERPARPQAALGTIRSLEQSLIQKGVHAERAPFGWTKKFSISIMGHPLAERSFRF